MFRRRRFIQSAVYGKASGVAFTPASLSNIIGWYPAGSGSLNTGTPATNGQNVTQQNDASGAGNHLTVSTGGGPLFNTTGFNGHPCINPDSSGNKSLATAANVVALPNVGTKMSCFIAINIDVANAGVENIIVAYLGNTQTQFFSNNASAALIETNQQHGVAQAWGNRSNFVYYDDITPPAPTFGNNTLVGTVYDGATWKMFVGNGTTGFAQVASVAATAPSFTGPGLIGLAGYGTQTGLVANIADMVITNDVMNTTDMANLWTYWHTTYGVG